MYPWHNTFHMGLVHFMAYPQASSRDAVLQTVTEVLTDEFFQAIEVSALLDLELLEEIGKLCKVARVELLLGAQPLVLSQKLNLNDFSKSERERAIRRLKEAIDKAYSCGAKAISFLSGKRPEKGKEEEAKKLLVESLIDLCRYAENRAKDAGYLLGVNLEVFDYAVDKEALVGPAPFAFEVASRVRVEHQNFGLTVDLSHIPLLFENASYTLTLLAPFVNHVHIGNAVLEKGHPAYGDLHPRFGIEGGCNDVDEVADFLRVLFRIGYFERKGTTERPVISFEVKPLPGEDPRLVVANAKRTFLAAWNRVCSLGRLGE
ncbi:MAG: TIM barrel protein [Candidatus Caldatribacterium sp.]|nr:TIM barrel protein [Candidatus Caldatribacterium sp.]